MQWVGLAYRPSILKVIDVRANVEDLVFCATQLTNLPSDITANFMVYKAYGKIPFSSSPSFPLLQLQIGGTGQVTTPCVNLDMLGLQNDLAMITDCHYGGKTVSMVRYLGKQNKIMTYPKLCDLNCVTDFDLSHSSLLHSGHLEQLAVGCPNLQRLNLRNCSGSLGSLQGLQAIASHCHYLQGLNIGGICFTKVQDHILLWDILNDMMLIHLAAEFCVFKPTAANMKKAYCLYQECWTIRGIQSDECHRCFRNSINEDTLILSYFPSLNYCNISHTKPAIIEGVINKCKELKWFRYSYASQTTLNFGDNPNLQEFCILALFSEASNKFLTSVSAHGGLVHVVMHVRSLTGEGITSLVNNSPKLITLYLVVSAVTIHQLEMENFNDTLKKTFCNRKLFTAGHYILHDKWDEKFLIGLMEQGTNLLPLWH